MLLSKISLHYPLWDPDLSYVADILGRGTLAAHVAVFRLARELSLEHLGTIGPGGVLLD